MTGLESFREQYPQYKDIPDQKLADALHAKYYSSIPKNEYYKKLGINQEVKATPEQSLLDKGLGIAKSVFEAPRKLTEGAISGLQDMGFGAIQTGAEVAQKLPIGEANKDIAKGVVEDIGKITGNKKKATKDQPLAFKAGELVPKIASTLAGGSKIIPAAITAATISEATTPKTEEESGLENRAIGAAKNTAATLLTAGALKLPSAARDLANKVIGAKPEVAEAFEKSGISPRLADVTSGQTTKTFQNLLANFPGSRGVIEKATQNQVDDIVKQLGNITNNQGGTIQEAGKTIQEGAKKVDQVLKNRIEKLYNNLDQYVPKTETGQSALIPTNNLSALVQKPEIQDVVAVGEGHTGKILNRLKEITGESGNISYDRLKIFRSTIGRKLQSPTLGGDERGAIKQIYAALSEDMKAAITTTGNEKALQSFNKANNAFARYNDALETKINPLIDAKTPEAVYQMALSGSKQGGSNIRGIMKSLVPEQKEFVRGTITKRMGLANAGEQDATGEVFSPNKFLTEWNKLSPEAKSNIYTNRQVEAVNNLNKVISTIKETSKAKQSSNNLPYAAWIGLGSLSLANLPAGIASVAGANITAKMMTSPKFINWLAKAPKISAPQIPNHLKQLSIIASQNPELREDILNYLGSITLGEDSQQ